MRQDHSSPEVNRLSGDAEVGPELSVHLWGQIDCYGNIRKPVACLCMSMKNMPVWR